MRVSRSIKKSLARIARITHHPSVDTLAVLSYHTVGNLATDSVSAANFETQMRYLAESHAVRHLDWSKPLPTSNTPTVLITFDDGFADNYHEAAPILKRYGIKALFFVTTGFIEQINLNHRFKSHSVLQPMSWNQLNRLLADGHSVGLHGHTNTCFSALTADQAKEEILTSLEIFQNRLGIRPNSFAYPVGQLEHQRRDLTDFFEKEGIPYLFTTLHRTVRYSKLLERQSGVLHIPRVRIDALDTGCVYREKLFGYWNGVAIVEWFISCLKTLSLTPHLRYQR